MTSATLNVTKRSTGSTSARALRRDGQVPATVYGHNSVPLSIAIESKNFLELLRSGAGHHLMTLSVEGTPNSVLLRSVQRDPVTQTIIHADFQLVDQNESIHASVPLVTTGTAPGVKNSGGVLDIVAHQIEISGPASQLPEHITFDIGSLEINSVVHASEIELPPGFTLVGPSDAVIVTLEPSRVAAIVEEATPEAPVQDTPAAE